MSEKELEDKLAAEWAAALEDSNEKEGADASASDAGGESEDDMAAAWAAALASEEEENTQAEQEKRTLRAQSQDVQFQDMTAEAKAPKPGHKRELDFILDIPLTVSAQLGTTQLLVNELLQLGQGSVVELNKLAGEPLEILVNGKLVARGEAVVINEKFGVRLTDIISPIERVKHLA